MAKNELNAIVLPDGDTFTPGQLSTLIFGEANAYQGGKRVRSYLRAKYARPSEAKNTSWILSRDVAQDVLDTFTAKTITVVTANDVNAPE